MTDQDVRRVTLTRDSLGRYTVRNGRGGSITTSSGTDELSPVELLLAGIAGCTAVDVDTVTSRRAEPDSFEIEVTADKVRDEQGNHLKDIEVTFRVRFPDGEDGDAAREILPTMVRRSHEEFCTVSRTVMLGATVTPHVE
ncbi:oxidoreductase [Intrasporangium chromatireducens Q5-1]|uniref:Oxidoreductase n=1 Tax=Intrasporangium chromatireducens Q5-1 TaxID=584657 RepID=W9GL62_9MICO|nr:OsmC family protein [Intrasporangium chromatireducens]EWT05538.1 oxidoreductase [Intrasporangium chromatireducens Q5-1]